ELDGRRYVIDHVAHADLRHRSQSPLFIVSFRFSVSARRLHALARPNRGQILAQWTCSLGIRRATSHVTPPQVELERVWTGLKTRRRVAGTPDAGFGSCKKDRANSSAGARRGDIQRRDAVAVDFDPANRDTVHRNPHVMVPQRSRYAIGGRSRGPL